MTFATLEGGMRQAGPWIALAGALAACSPQMFADIGTAQTYTKDIVLPAVPSGGLDPLWSDFALKNSDPATMARLGPIYQKLGPLRSAQEVSCRVTASANTDPALNGIFADCYVDATFENAAAAVTTRLRKVDAGWKLDAVNVNSDLFAKLMEQGAATAPAAAAAPDAASVAPTPATRPPAAPTPAAPPAPEGAPPPPN
jgi:hypothetical protein